MEKHLIEAGYFHGNRYFEEHKVPFTDSSGRRGKREHLHVRKLSLLKPADLIFMWQHRNAPRLQASSTSVQKA